MKSVGNSSVLMAYLSCWIYAEISQRRRRGRMDPLIDKLSPPKFKAGSVAGWRHKKPSCSQP